MMNEDNEFRGMICNENVVVQQFNSMAKVCLCPDQLCLVAKRKKDFSLLKETSISRLKKKNTLKLIC